jgi:DNA replication protein DnaC
VKECDCSFERRVVARLPERYREASLLDFPKAIQDFVTAWFGSQGDGLFLTGEVGTGKTHLAAAIVRTLVLIRREAYFKSCSAFYAAIRKCYGPHSETTEDMVMREYTSHKYLVLDDLGAGSLSDHERRCTLDLLNDRMNKCWPTIITSNWGLPEIQVRMDDRISSRIASFQALHLAGRDRRVQQSREKEGRRFA